MMGKRTPTMPAAPLGANLPPRPIVRPSSLTASPALTDGASEPQPGVASSRTSEIGALEIDHDRTTGPAQGSSTRRRRRASSSVSARPTKRIPRFEYPDNYDGTARNPVRDFERSIRQSSPSLFVWPGFFSRRDSDRGYVPTSPMAAPRGPQARANEAHFGIGGENSSLSRRMSGQRCTIGSCICRQLRPDGINSGVALAVVRLHNC